MKRFLLFSLILFVGCSNDDDFSLPYDHENPIVGMWDKTYIESTVYDLPHMTVNQRHTNELTSHSYMMLSGDNIVYLGNDPHKRGMKVGTFEYRNDSLLIESSTYPGSEGTQKIIELSKTILRTEITTDDGSEDGTLNITKYTFKRHQ